MIQWKISQIFLKTDFQSSVKKEKNQLKVPWKSYVYIKFIQSKLKSCYAIRTEDYAYVADAWGMWFLCEYVNT